MARQKRRAEREWFLSDRPIEPPLHCFTQAVVALTTAMFAPNSLVVGRSKSP